MIFTQVKIISGTSHSSVSITENNVMTVIEKGVIKTANNYTTAVSFKGERSKLKLGDVRIESGATALATVKKHNIITMEKGSIKSGNQAAVEAHGQNSIIELGNVQIEATAAALQTGHNATITMEKGSIKAQGYAVQANGQNSMIKLGDIQIESEDGGISAHYKSIVTMEKGSIKGVRGIDLENGSIVKINNVQIEAKQQGAFVTNGSTLIMNKSFIKAKEDGIGIYLESLTGKNNDSRIGIAEKRTEIKLTDVVIEAGKAGISTQTYASQVNFNLKNSEIHSNVLIKNNVNSRFNFTLNADHSILEGGALVNPTDYMRVIFNLSNGTVWTPKISKEEKKAVSNGNLGGLLDISTRSRSAVSVLNLDNSTIVFDKPTNDQYQELHVGHAIPNAASRPAS
ncbi:hypothetical protein BAR153v2_008930 [Bartonella sp. AR 15-3]|nr:hypothetical protein BAR153v2_008930 [Bartonella sp. AR 15-3]